MSIFNKFIFKNLFRLLLVVFLGHASSSVASSCVWLNGNSLQINTINLTGSISIPRDAPVGTVVKTVQIPAFSGVFARCTGPGVSQWNYYGGAPASFDNSVVSTNVPGIGIRFYVYNSCDGKLSLFGAAPHNGNPYQANPFLDWNFSGCAQAFWGVDVVVTGPFTSGMINSANYAKVYLDPSFEASRILINSNLSVSQASCTTPDVTVNLGNHFTSEFSGIGSTSSSTAFNIALNSCPSSLGAIKYKLDPVTSLAGSYKSVVTLDSSSTATGVGVQLTDNNDNWIQLSSELNFSGYTSGAQGNFNIPLKARYYQTASKVTAGTANTSLTFSILYR